MFMNDIVPDDVLRAIAARKLINKRTAAVNARRIEKAFASGVQDVELID